MPMSSMVRATVVAALCVATDAPSVDAQPSPSRALRSDSVILKEWTVPWGAESRPRDPALGADGRIWFVGQEGNYVARLDPGSGRFTRVEIDAGTNPHTVNVDREGNAWYTGNRNGMIGRIDGKSGVITRYPMPDSAAKDPHTIAFDKRGDLWFTLQNSNMVGHLTRATGKTRLVTMAKRGSRPYGIVIDSKGRPWFNLFGTNAIGSIDPATMKVSEYPLPDARARGRRIALTSDGAVWYVDYVRGFLGRLDAASGVVKEWQMPGGTTALPYAMTVDDYDRLWFVETGRQPNRLVGFDPRGEKFFGHTDIGPVAPNTVRHMVFDKDTRAIWFGTDRGTIGRAIVPKGVGTPIS